MNKVKLTLLIAAFAFLAAVGRAGPPTIKQEAQTQQSSISEDYCIIIEPAVSEFMLVNYSPVLHVNICHIEPLNNQQHPVIMKIGTPQKTPYNSQAFISRHRRTA